MIKQIKVMIVEDNPLNQKIISYYLIKEKYQIKLVTNGEDCVEMFKNEWYDVLLMDLMLPGIDGYETTRQIRMIEKENYCDKKTFIIALTANTLDNDKERCIKNGLNDYLSKPFEIKKLQIILETLQY